MNTYFERIDSNERREEEWRLLNSALMERRNHVFHHHTIDIILWILGFRP